MPRSSVAFAITAPEEVARERVRAVLRFYDACGDLEVRVRRDQALNLTVGEVLIGRDTIDGAARAGTLFSAGERLPAGLSTALELLDASDAQLRAADGAQAAVVARDGRARLIAGAGAAGCWFQAGDAYATSIAAATLLGSVAPLINPDALPELIVLGTCLGERTHIKGVRSLPPSAVIDFGSREREAWPRLARWAAVDPQRAGEHAWSALVETVGARLGQEPSPWVRLDEQGDATLLLAAAAELGIDVPAFSATDEYGAPMQTGTAVQARELALRNALLGDGTRSLQPFDVSRHPHTASCVLTGFGGQIARRAGYPDRLLELTPADHRPAIEIKLREWFEHAAQSGPANWSAFDMLLIEEGVGGDRPDLPYPTREPLRSPEFARALSSLSPEERATGEWRSAALGEINIENPPAAEPADGWERLPEIGRWLIDEPLAHPLLETALGDLWVQRLVEGVRDGDAAAREQALLAAAAVIFDQRLQAAAQPTAGK
jgi:hypothetical protein